MSTPLLYHQLHSQLRQWIIPKDKRHLIGFAENVAAILQSESACLSHWITYLTHRNCQARSQMERLSYFVNNPRITAETFYDPLIKQFLQGWEGSELILTLDTSQFWEEFCLVEVCMAWGGRSFPLAQKVLEHRSAMISYQDYREVLERASSLLPNNSQITLLADRGFEHGELIRWLEEQSWSWAIRAKSDLKITFCDQRSKSVKHLLPPLQQAYLFSQVTVLEDIHCHLATAHVSHAEEPWAVITNTAPCLQTFFLYGQRFGGIEPHFKDYKSSGFSLLRSRLRTPQALQGLLMLLATATIIAISLAVHLLMQGQRSRLDWHSQRGFSFLQLGLRELNRLCYQRLPLPAWIGLPRTHPPSACASRKKREELSTRIEFSKVTVFPYGLR